MRKLSFDILSKLLTAIPLLLVVAPVAYAADPLSSMEEQGAAIDRDEQSGKVTFIGKGREQPVSTLNDFPSVNHDFNPGANNVPGYSATNDDKKNASTILQTFGRSFGLSNPADQMQVMRKDIGKELGLVHYQQMHGGIPVIGGELVISMANHKFSSMNGEVSQDLPQSTTPGISSDSAMATAKLLVQQQYGLYDPNTTLETTTPELLIYDPKLLDIVDKNGPARLVWKIEIYPAGPSDIHELVLVDAQTGSVALHFNKTAEAKNRLTYNAGGRTDVGTLVCQETTNCVGSDTDIVLAHKYAGDTYDFYYNYLRQQDSLDGRGYPLRSFAHFGVGFQNALWDGSEMLYGDGYASADDVVGHELTHGLTQFMTKQQPSGQNPSGLSFSDNYTRQTGAINESFSDIFGEFIDLTNGAGTDTPDVAWLIGDDLPTGAIRDISNPPRGLQPDRMTSPLFNYLGLLGENGYIDNNQQPDTQVNDNLGVHINSGVGNKAAFLMTSGDTFNNVVVPGIGVRKVARIYYQAYRYLTAGTQYSNLFHILQQSCSDLTSIQVTTPADCDSVYRAVVAVEMYKPPIH